MSNIKTMYVWKISFLYSVCFLSTNLGAEQLKFVHHKKYERNLHRDVMAFLIELFDVRTFIETGTFRGASSLEAANLFQDVHTIELSKELLIENKKRFENYENVHLYQGDSAEVLPRIVPKILGKKLFFLDGHFMGGISALGSEVTPILTELDSLRYADDIKNCVVIIDDLRLFKTQKMKGGFFGDKNYPYISDLVAKIYQINQNYKIAIMGDSLLVFDQTSNIDVSPIVEACTLHRLYSSTLNSKKLKELESVIASVEGDEFIWLQQTANFIQNDVAIPGAHYQFWLGLALLKKAQFDDALYYFNRAIHFGYDQENIYEYITRAIQKNTLS